MKTQLVLRNDPVLNKTDCMDGLTNRQIHVGELYTTELRDIISIFILIASFSICVTLYQYLSL